MNLTREKKIHLLKELEKGNNNALKELIPCLVAFQINSDTYKINGKHYSKDEVMKLKNKINLLVWDEVKTYEYNRNIINNLVVEKNA